jgi:hypothetical protein
MNNTKIMWLVFTAKKTMVIKIEKKIIKQDIKEKIKKYIVQDFSV